MKLRKSKSDLPFTIDFSPWVHTVVKNKGNVGGYEVRDQKLGPRQTVEVIAHNRAAALKGFLWGQDRHNIRISRCVPTSRL
jgi:hypothetical protein